MSQEELLEQLEPPPQEGESLFAGLESAERREAATAALGGALRGAAEAAEAW